MDLLSFSQNHPHYRAVILSLLFIFEGVSGAKFTFANKCDSSVWPGILGSPKLDSTGFELTKGSSRSFQVPTGWSGRFWGRTGCNFDSSGHGSCATADCGSGQVECNGAGATPPATLAEFTLGSGSQDFYDVSLVDGYNLPMIVEVSGGSGECASTGCVTDLNRKCPAELRAEGGGACRSACEAFGKPEYCCSGEYNSPASCKPSMYSQVFKSACPKSYSYAYDDATSTFTCTGADYTITFCPSFHSVKSSSDSSPKAMGAQPLMMGQEQRRRQEAPTPDPQHRKLNYRVHGWRVWQSESQQEHKPTIPCSSDLHQLWPHLSFFPTFTCSHHHHLIVSHDSAENQ